MDRLFGKQLSNIQQNQHNKLKQVGRIHSQTNRSVSDQPAKMLIKRFNRSSLIHPQPKKCDRTDATLHERHAAEVVNQDGLAKSEDLAIGREFGKEGKDGREGKEGKEGREAKDIICSNKDPQMVEEYFQDCFGFMMGQEAKNYSLNNYIGEQGEINEKMRAILLDWIIDLHYKFKMFPQTLYATVTIIDLYLSKRQASKENLQLIGTAALYIAAKYEETYQVPDLNDLVHFSAKAFTREQIVRMEADIIEALDFNLIMETSFRFFEPLAKVCGMEEKNFHLAQYVLELSLLDMKFLANKPSLMASSAIYLINKIRKRPQSWPARLVKLTGYEEKELKNCARELCYLLQRAQQLSHTKSLKKKFSSIQFHEVTRIKLERKKQ